MLKNSLQRRHFEWWQLSNRWPTLLLTRVAIRNARGTRGEKNVLKRTFSFILIFLLAPDEGLFSNRNIGQICLNIYFCFIILFTSSSPSRFIFFYTLLLYWSRSTAGMGDTAPLIGCRCGLANFLYILASFRRALRTVWPDKSICKENSTINQDYPARCLFLTDIHSSDWF